MMLLVSCAIFLVAHAEDNATDDGGGGSTTEHEFCPPAMVNASWTESQCRAIYQIRTAGGILSMLGCCFIFGVIWMGRRYRNFNQRLVMYLAIAALIGSWSYFVADGHRYPNPDDVSSTCTWQAFWVTFFDWSILLWVICITHSMYVNVVRLEPSNEYEYKYHGLCWGFAFVIAIIPLALGYYEDTGMWCWIDGEKSWARFTLWYVPLMLCIIGMFGVNGYIRSKVDDMAKQWQGTFNPQIEAHKTFLKEQVRPLRWYPLVYLACAIFPFINRVQNWAEPLKPQFWLYVMHGITYPLVGFLNALVYAVNMDEGFWKECTFGHFTRRLRQADAGASKNVQEYTITNIPSLNDQDDGDSDDDNVESGQPISRRSSGLL